ncbi:hypothetical protein HSIEG1_962 [Enterococcus sp. HSIEG1]|nr:hypothetical protein HSIEG1_962 [Enterococcus sp. HSIEG1]
MKLINVTNSHSRLVMNQLENTDAEMVKVYTAGDITVIFTSAPNHNEILLINKKRAIKPTEIEEIKHYFLKNYRLVLMNLKRSQLLKCQIL